VVVVVVVVVVVCGVRVCGWGRGEEGHQKACLSGVLFACCASPHRQTTQADNQTLHNRRNSVRNGKQPGSQLTCCQRSAGTTSQGCLGHLEPG
jgi:hypothetical protein